MHTYDQARADHEYLWKIGPAYDMTGAYVDQEDLEKLLKKPTKKTATACYVSQIVYWLQTGPDVSDWRGQCTEELYRLLRDDDEVIAIHERYIGPIDQQENGHD